jgi:hypothetical protein
MVLHRVISIIRCVSCVREETKSCLGKGKRSCAPKKRATLCSRKEGAKALGVVSSYWPCPAAACLSNVPRENGMGKERHTPRNALLPGRLFIVQMPDALLAAPLFSVQWVLSTVLLFLALDVLFAMYNSHTHKSQCNPRKGRVPVFKGHAMQAYSRC